ncbi:MAG: M23 family metallopeptidase [Saprospiraceae bacterium]|nr:M23 family metallopeptidase [Saprospiraceae bacterium]
MTNRFTYFLIFHFIFSSKIVSQHDQLILDREKLKTQIQETENILRKTKKDQAQIVKNAQILQKQIADRKKLLSTLALESELLQKELDESNKAHRLQLEKLELLKKNYYQSLRKKWVLQQYQRTPAGWWSNEELKPMVMRIVWTDQLNRNKEKKYKEYKSAQEIVLKRHQEIAQKLKDQKMLIQSRDTQTLRLERDLEEELRMAKLSTTQQREYESQMKKYQQEMLRLEKTISQKIYELQSSEPVTTTSSGNWHFPLKDGTIITRFGKHTDPRNKHVKINNNGIDIRSNHSFVSSSQDAEIVQIKEMPNGSYMVMARKGNLYMVYSNLDQVLVRQGENIQSGNHIGQCRSTNGGQFELHFEVWKGKTPEDPLKYIGN